MNINESEIKRQMEKTYGKYKNSGYYDFEIDKRIFHKDIQKLLEENIEDN